MDLKTIGLYGLAGFGAYALYEKMTATSNYSGTDWQRSGIRGTSWQDNNTNFTGTSWQQAGRNRETMWQEGNVFSNANGTATPGATRDNLQGTDWQNTNMSNACGDTTMSNACGSCA